MLDYPTTIDKAFFRRHGNSAPFSGVQKINMRYEVAKTLFTEKYSHLTAELEERVDNQQDEELAQWNMLFENISLAENVSE